MNIKWQFCSFEQSLELSRLGVKPSCEQFAWMYSKTDLKDHAFAIMQSDENYYLDHPLTTNSPVRVQAYSLGDIALMLGYTFVPSNAKTAAEKLIEEIKNGISKVSDVNANILEMYNQK